MIGKETKCADDALPQQPVLSASALLKEHEKTMKAMNDKKRSLETACDTLVDNDRLTDMNNITASVVTDKDGSVVRSSPSESKSVKDAAGVESQLAQHHVKSNKHAEKEPGHTSKQAEKPQYRVPELGRGLNVSCSGFVDLDDIPCSSATSTVTCDSAKVS